MAINKRTETTKWSGNIIFYDSYREDVDPKKDNKGHWIELKAIIKNGKLNSIEILKDERKTNDN